MTMSQVIQIDATYVATKLKEWAAKSGRTPGELQAQFQDIFAKCEAGTEAGRFKKALNLLKRSFETSMNSNAVTYKVILLGMPSPYDAVKKRRTDILERYAKTPGESITSGEVILANGIPVPMDLNRTFPGSGKENPFYGKPIPNHSWMTNVIAVAMKPEEDKKWMPASISLRGEEFIQGEIPFGREMDLRLNGTYNGGQGRYLLNSSKGATNFSTLGRELSSDELSNLVDEVYGDKFVLAGNLVENLEENKSDPGRFIVTEGILNSHFKNTEPGKLSSIVISDETLDLGETIRGFVDSSIAGMLDRVQNGDTVTVIGRTSMGKGYDSETKQRTDEDVLMMNVYAVIPRPE